MRDGSMKTKLIATNPASQLSEEIEFHIESKCSTAVITQEVAEKLQLQFLNLSFFIGEAN